MPRAPRSVHLGFEIGTGSPVSIPAQHLVITGQTQRAGKTTALEALISRSSMKAVAFVTKRGEGSFVGARTIPPYFREQADWQFVASILEASRGEKLKFERAWIIRASRGARTLADVHRNVKKAMEKYKTGMSADVYLTLDAYLDVVVPEIDRVRWSSSVLLAPGISVMDLTGITVELQHLVIRSTLDWVLNHETDTVVVVPEAWKFIPQGRGTPVKLAAESYIRQAAGLRNYLWLDSQDIAGVEKIILKSVPVWILGVQREANEIKRTLSQIPAGMRKPKPGDVATLGLGQFFVCHDAETTKAYAQPIWMDDETAIDVARGDAKLTIDPEKFASVHTRSEPKESAVNEREAQQLRDDRVSLIAENAKLKEELASLRADEPRETAPAGRTSALPPRRDDEQRPGGYRFHDLYKAIKAKLIEELPSDPAVMRIVVSRPELRVEVERAVVTADGSTWLGRTAQLIAEGYFDTPRKAGEVFREAQRRGQSGVAPRADEACKKLHTMGFLTREPEGFLAVPGMKVNIVRA
jgi:hypothetical protein